MSQLLNRFSFSTAQWNSHVVLSLVIVWMVMVICAVSSIRSQGYSDSQRRFWTWLVILVPFFGLLAYLPFSFRHEDLPTHLTLRTREKRPRGGRGAFPNPSRQA